MTARTSLPFEALDLPEDEILRRFRWARHRGHPRYVWPDLTMTDWARGCRAVAEVTGRVLSRSPFAGAASGTASGGPTREPLDTSAGADAVAVAAFTTGMGPLLGRWLEDGRVEVEEGVAQVLELHLRHGRARAERIRTVLDQVVDALAPVAPPVLLLKGAHTGHLLFPEPGTRPMADVDLLVDGRHFSEAEEALRSRGFRCTGSRRGPRRSAWEAPGTRTASPTGLRSLSLCHAGQPVCLDVHASLARDFYGVHTVDPGPLAGRDLVSVPAAGSEVFGLAPPLLFLVLATHASEDLHNLQLVRLVELALLGRCLGGSDGGWHEALERARRTGALRFCYPAVELAESLLPGCVDDAYLAAARDDAPHRLVRVVEGLEPGVAQALDRLSLEERLLWARGPREVLLRLRRMVVPDSARGSWPALLEIYVSRVLRLIRGRVRLRSGDGEARR